MDLEILKKAIMNKRMKKSPEIELEIEQGEGSEMQDAEKERDAQGLAPEVEMEVEPREEGLYDEKKPELKAELELGSADVDSGILSKLFQEDDLGKPGINGKVAAKMKAAMDMMKSKKMK